MLSPLYLDLRRELSAACCAVVAAVAVAALVVDLSISLFSYS